MMKYANPTIIKIGRVHKVQAMIPAGRAVVHVSLPEGAYVDAAGLHLDPDNHKIWGDLGLLPPGTPAPKKG